MPDSNGNPTLSDLLSQAYGLSDRLNKEKQIEGDRAHDLSKISANNQNERGMLDYKNKLGQETSARNLNTLSDLIGSQARKGVKVGGSLGADGQVSLSHGESNPMVNIAMDERRMARDDRDLVKLGERVAKANIPVTMAGINNLESGTSSKDATGKPVGGIVTNKDYNVKSAGPWANIIRQVPGGSTVLNVGERIGAMPKGAQEEDQLIARLVNQDIRNMSGTAVTLYEQGRQNVEKGKTGAGDPSLIKLGIKQMTDAIAAEGANIEASSRPGVVNTYRQQGGKIQLNEFLQQPSKMTEPKKPMSFEEFKKAKAEGRI